MCCCMCICLCVCSTEQHRAYITITSCLVHPRDALRRSLSWVANPYRAHYYMHRNASISASCAFIGCWFPVSSSGLFLLLMWLHRTSGIVV